MKRSLLVLLAGVAWLAAASSSCSKPTPVEHAPMARTLFTDCPLPAEAQDLRLFTLDVWLHRQHVFELNVRGRGKASVKIQAEEGPPEPWIDLDLNDQVMIKSFDLPGEGSRYVRLHFESDKFVSFVGARFGQDEQPVREVDTPTVTANDPNAAQSRMQQKTLKRSMKGRDVVMFVMDTLAADHLGAWGYQRATSPAWDSLAEDGVRFSKAFSQTSWTLPSVVSLFTSLDQENHGVTKLTQGIPDGISPLGERFKEAGYYNVALVQNGVASQSSGFGRGFDRFEKYNHKLNPLNELFQRAEALLRAERDQPLFLYVHVLPPHGPFLYPGTGESRFNPLYDGPADHTVASVLRIQKEKLGPDHPDVRHMIALYDEYLHFADQKLADLRRVTEELEENGQPVLWVATSDHGEAFMEHGFIGHEHHIYNEMLHVPLIFYAKDSDLASGHSIHEPVSLLDVYPTLVDLCGLPRPLYPVQGRSLLPMLEPASFREQIATDGSVIVTEPSEQEPEPRPMFFSARYRDRGVRPQLGVLLEGYKLVRSFNKQGETFELFDMQRDPDETLDVSAEHSIRAGALRNLSEHWLTAPKPDRSTAATVELTEEEKEALRELGYSFDFGDDQD